MQVYFVGAGPGDPGLITVRGRELLETCQMCIYAGSLVNPVLLEWLPETCLRYDSAALSLDEMADLYQQARDRNLDVVRLHSGDPSIYGAIREQMHVLDRLGIEYKVVPGVSAFQASAAALSTELTAPEISQSIVLTRMGGRTPVPESQSLDMFARTQATLCLFLSIQQISDIVSILIPHYAADCPCAVVYHASWPDQLILRGTLADIAARVEAAGLQKTALIVVGRALTSGTEVSRLYDAAFTHEYRCGQAA